MHIYHSVKGSSNANDNGIRHRVSTDGGETWGTSELVLTTGLQPGTDPAESIAGKYFPNLLGTGKGAMVLITDGGVGSSPLHAYVSSTEGNMSTFVSVGPLRPSELPPAPPSVDRSTPFGPARSSDGAHQLGKGSMGAQRAAAGLIPPKHRHGSFQMLPPALPYYPIPRGNPHTRGNTWSFTVG